MLLKTEEAARVLEELKDSEPRLKVIQRDAIETAIESLLDYPSKKLDILSQAGVRK